MTGGYPPGAADDSRAPYNQPSIEKLYHDASIEVECWYDHGERSVTKSVDYQWTQIDSSGVEIWVEEPEWHGDHPENFIEDFTETILPQFRGLQIYSIHLL